MTDFAPDSLAWEALGVGHSAWTSWLLSGQWASFYDGLRWAWLARGDRRADGRPGDRGVPLPLVGAGPPGSRGHQPTGRPDA
ncbi:DUF2625 family protein [Kitasatospora griseola]|uniref:DUF2625 family protein n=1 Tax=Kitasatospora griseola TaxID=2064 RepID=UPI0036DF24A5